MGQKTHPLGFRLGITNEHKSNWYAKSNQYSEILKEDVKIRTYLNKISRENAISNVKINRNGLNNNIQLNIETAKPGIFVGEFGEEIDQLLTNLRKLISPKHQLTINILKVKRTNLDAGLLGDYIVKLLENRIPFRRAIRQALKCARHKKFKTKVKGIKIQVSGRLNGAEMARSEWIREGRVPLQTLRANIDYATREAHTIYGILGVKVWVLKKKS